ncbi:hypothetical protein CU098_004647, partial [Rhizopus stolonifer]
KYNFTGIQARQFAISNLLVKHFSEFEDAVLEALLRKFHDISKLYKIISQQYQLKEHVMAPYLHNTIDHIIGILYRFYGIAVVEKFIEAAVVQVIHLQLKTAFAFKNPIWELNNLIATIQGDVEYSFATLEDNVQFQVIVKVRLASSGCIFSHTRIAYKKQKAKALACKDILNYFEKHPNVYEQLMQVASPQDSSVVYPLPIPKEDYVVADEFPYPEPATPTPQSKAKSKNQPVNWSTNDPNHMHINPNDYQDSIQLLSDLLLGEGTEDNEDVNMSDESPNKKKRTRDNKPPQLTERSEPHIKQEPDLEAESVSLLSTIKQPSPRQSTLNHRISLQPLIPEQISPQEQRIQTQTNNILATPKPLELNEKVLIYFKKIFGNHQRLLHQSLSSPGQCKSIFMSLIVQNQDKVFCKVKSEQMGPSHAPLFTVEVVLKSKFDSQVFIKTNGIAKRKKDADQLAFCKLVEIIAK